MNADLGQQLCEVARRSIAHGGQGEAPAPRADSPELAEHRASFVTLHLEERLRGCIGSLAAQRPLITDVHANAWCAAYRDPRFAPLPMADVVRVRIHVSVLTPMEPLAFAGERDLIERLQPGRDGLLIRQGERRATFLPAVWDQLPEPADFLAALKRKAGILPGTENYVALRYRAEGWHSEVG